MEMRTRVAKSFYCSLDDEPKYGESNAINRSQSSLESFLFKFGKFKTC